ncbi:hypothetical protein FHG87_005246 [Trinorchestia longiramus]|nr:hypothetical protein FHG87_005246 [Trinorchestia longiramus]
MAGRSRVEDGSYLPSVSDSVPTFRPPSLLTPGQRCSPGSMGSEVPMIEHMRRSSSRNTLESRSMMGSIFTTNHFNSFIINDLTNYSMNDQRWTLQRKKIGLKRRTKGASEKKSRDLKTRDITLNFMKQFRKKECTKFVASKSRRDVGSPVCHCGLQQPEHLTFATVPVLHQSGHGVDMSINLQDPDQLQSLDVSARDHLHTKGARAAVSPRPEPIAEEEDQDFDEKILLPSADENETRDGAMPRDLLAAEGIVNRRQRNTWHPTMTSMMTSPGSSYLVSGMGETQHAEAPCFTNFVTPRSKLDVELIFTLEEASGASLVLPKELLKNLDGEEDKSNKDWNMGKYICEFPTDAYGLLDIVNETSGSSKPAKYVRMSNATSMAKVLALLTDYWRLAEPKRPNLVLSVTGGAKNFKLDGNKKAVFTTGLIKAVRSTNAWLLTGGMHVGVMRSVGEAVNEGQHIIKVKRKSLFTEQESVHLVRGIKCLGVAPFGYIKDYKSLINPDPSEFSNIKYKIDEKVEKKANISLNGDHTHFILVDNGMRHSFSGADRFRTRLEEAIQAPEPTGLGTPVVLLLLEGGMSSIVKCSMALKGRIPVVVVAGTGRAADLLAYGVSMTHETPSYVFDEVHENSMEIWKYERFRLIREYDSKPGLVPPIVILEHIYRFTKWFWKTFLRKRKENLEDYMTSTLLTLRIFEKEAVSSFLAQVQLSHEASLDQRVSRISEKIDLIAKYVEEEQELRNIEEDLEWASQQLEVDEDMVERHHIDELSSASDIGDMNNPKKSRQKRKTEKEEITTNDAGKGLTDSDEEDETCGKPTPIEAVALNTQNRRKTSVNRKISVGKCKNSSLSLDSNLHSILKNKQDPVAQITTNATSANRRLTITSSPYENFVNHTVEDVLEEELSEEDMEEKLHSTARALSPSSASMKMSPAKKNHPQLGGGWDGELHYPSRPTSATLLCQSSARRGLSADRRAIGSAKQIMNQMDTLNYRIETLSANVEKFQMKFERLANSLGDAGPEKECTCASRSPGTVKNQKTEFEVNFVEPLNCPDDVIKSGTQKSGANKTRDLHKKQ